MTLLRRLQRRAGLQNRVYTKQAVGNNVEADRLLAQALEIDPDTVADVLREHDAGRAPDARLQDLADQDVEKVLPRITPGPA